MRIATIGSVGPAAMCAAIRSAAVMSGAAPAALVLALALAPVPAAAADECPNRGQLDTAYCDANNDLVADVPARTRDPSVIVFAYTPVEDPAVYENAFKPFTTYLSQCTGKRVVYYPVQSNSAEIEAMRSGRLHVAGFSTGPLGFAVNMAGAVPFAAKGREGGPEGYNLIVVVKKDSPFQKLADLKGKRVAVTRGTDPHIFLIRALASVGLSEKDIQIVLLQHADGRTALDRGDVDAWAGLDPMMASAEIDNGDTLFYRDRSANTYGILDVRESFAAEHPDAVRKVIAAYEQARLWALAHPAEFKALIVKETGLAAPVIDRQIDQRTDLSQSAVGDAQRNSILAAGLALQKAGVVPATADVSGSLDALIDTRFEPVTR